MSESLADLRKRLMFEHETQNNTFSDFPVGTRVEIITPCEDFTFFTVGIEGIVIENTYEYLGIMVRFDDNTKFNFNPKSLKVVQTLITSDSTHLIPLKTYSEEQYNKDLCEFAEWTSKNDWHYNSIYEVWRKPKYAEIALPFITKKTSDLQMDWEIETERRKP